MKKNDVFEFKKNIYAYKSIPKGNKKMKIFIIYLFVFIHIITLKFIIYKNPPHSHDSRLFKDKMVEKKDTKYNDIQEKNKTIYDEIPLMKNETKNIIEIKNDTKPKLINFKEYKLTFSTNIEVSNFFENKYFSISNISYSSSYKYDIVKLEYNIAIYDEDQNLIYPSDLSLYYNFNVFCFLEMNKIKINIYSLPGIDQNSYYKCVEFFKFDEKPSLGIKIGHKKGIEFDFYKIIAFQNDINYNDLSFKNDTEFDPDYINYEYKNLVDKTKNKYLNKTLRFKEYYMQSPLCNLRRSIAEKSGWLFKNIYNYYFCFCVGISCLSLEIPQRSKYYKYMDIIENNRNLYPKTDYLFVDFIFKDLTSDDAFPIFEEMEKKNYPVHYITEHNEIYEKYCKDEKICSKIIKLGKDYDNYADFFEKHLTLVLKLKAVVSCKESGFHFASYLFYRLEYITYIAVTHGVCYFKDYLFEKKRIYGNMRNNKIIIPPSHLLIEKARKYGWRNEDIIKMNLPRWDKYNEEYQLKNKDEFKRINSNSILVMFTWRYNKDSFNIDISPFYHENISRILESDLLNDALERKNITLYFTFHRYINKRFRERYENIIKEKKQIKFIEQGDIAQCLAVTKLVVSDFSSIIFDLMYRRKPFILFIPDGNDPKIKDIYTDDYIKLINDMYQKKYKVENLFYNVRETVDKMISYIDNNFTIDKKLEKYFELFGIKKGNNIDAFIDYLTNLK